MNRPKAIGTAAETAVVRWLRLNGFPNAERRALAGFYDLGDVTGCPGLVFECKSGQVAYNATPAKVAKWMAETETETQNAQADYGVLVVKRQGSGAVNAGAWWAYLDSHSVARLHGQYRPSAPNVTVRMSLADAVALLRHAGYGDPLTSERTSA